jgi:hypothetical protein
MEINEDRSNPNVQLRSWINVDASIANKPLENLLRDLCDVEQRKECRGRNAA